MSLVHTHIQHFHEQSSIISQYTTMQKMQDNSLHKLCMMYSIVYTKLSFSLLSHCGYTPRSLLQTCIYAYCGHTQSIRSDDIQLVWPNIPHTEAINLALPFLIALHQATNEALFSPWKHCRAISCSTTQSIKIPSSIMSLQYPLPQQQGFPPQFWILLASGDEYYMWQSGRCKLSIISVMYFDHITAFEVLHRWMGLIHASKIYKYLMPLLSPGLNGNQ